METRWHIPKGTIISNARVEDLSRELHISSSNYRQVTKHLTRQADLDAETAQDEARKRAIKEASDALVRHWGDPDKKPDPLELEEEDELDKARRKNAIELRAFLQVKKEQDAERKMYVDKMRAKMMMRKDFPKALGSAYLFSEVLYERVKQQEFAKTLKNHDDELELRYIQEMREDVAKYEEEEAEKRRQQRAKDEAYSRGLLKRNAKLKAKETKTYEMRVQEELIEQERALREYECIERVRKDKIERSRQFVRDALAESLEDRKKVNAEREEDERALNAVPPIVQKSRDHIRCLLLENQKKKTEERLAHVTRVFDTRAQKKREDELQRMHDRGAAKLAEVTRKRDKREADNAERIRNERLEIQKECLEKMQHDTAANMKQWGMANRFKMIEVLAKENEQEKQAEVDKNANMMKLYDWQHNAKKERLAAEQAAADGVKEAQRLVEKNAADDEDYLDYAKEVRKLTEESGWPTLPIDRTVAKYQQEMMGVKPPKRCDKMKLKVSCPHVTETAGKRTHCPHTDPHFQYKEQKDKVLN